MKNIFGSVVRRGIIGQVGVKIGAKLEVCSFLFFYVDQFEQSSGPGHHPMQSTLEGGITYKRGGKVAGHGSCMAVVCKVSPVPS